MTEEGLMATRVVNIRGSEFDVYIGRPSKWGNPFVLNRDGCRIEVIKKYRKWLLAHPDLIEDARRELKDKVLGCYCKPSACHGDVLADIVNTMVSE